MKRRFIFVFLLTISVFVSAQNAGDHASDFSFTDRNGVPHTLSQLKGSVVLLFTLGNTCSSCIAAGPNVQSLVDEFESQGLEALGLDFWDASSSVTTVSSFVAMTGIQFPVLLKAGSLASAYSTTYDRLIIVDRDGKIAFKGSRLAVNDLIDAKAVLTNLLSSTFMEHDAVPDAFILAQNHPNPFNPTTVIRYQLSSVSRVWLEVFDLLGNSVQVLVDQVQHAGDYRVQFVAHRLPAGAYFYRLNANGQILTRKMVLMR